MTPKSLLRSPEVAAQARGDGARHLLPSPDRGERSARRGRPGAARRAVQRQGLFRSAATPRRERKIDDVAILRLEQLYPFPARSLAEALARYQNAEIVWCQEEPENMGAWTFVDRRIETGAGVARHQGEARPLCRPARGGGDRDRAAEAAQRRAGAARCRGAGAGLIRSAGEGKMATDIKVPTLGESVTEATVARWLKKVGDSVALDDPLVELETDKVTLEVSALGEPARSPRSSRPRAATSRSAVLLGRIAEGPAKPAAKPALAPAASCKPPLRPPPSRKPRRPARRHRRGVARALRPGGAEGCGRGGHRCGADQAEREGRAADQGRRLCRRAAGAGSGRWRGRRASSVPPRSACA